MRVDAPRTPILPYRDTSWLDALPAYDVWWGSDAQLDILRRIQQAGAYYWGCRAVPSGNINFLAGQTLDGHFSPEAGTYITMIQGFSDQGAGFRLQVYDAGARTNLFGRVFGKDKLSTGEMAVNSAAPALPVFGPHILQSPLPILTPGLVNVSITNLATVAAQIQVAFVLAIPVTRLSLSQLAVREK